MKNSKYYKLIVFLGIFSLVLLVAIAAQAIVTSLGSTPDYSPELFDFANYSVMGWIAQTLGFFLVLGTSCALYISIYEEEDENTEDNDHQLNL